MLKRVVDARMRADERLWVDEQLRRLMRRKATERKLVLHMIVARIVDVAANIGGITTVECKHELTCL